MLRLAFDAALDIRRRSWRPARKYHAVRYLYIALLTDENPHDFVIQVLMGDKVSICGIVGLARLQKGTTRFECQPVIVGSIVKIQTDKAMHTRLTLAEVEVFGVYGKVALLNVLYYSLLFTSDR